MLFFKTKEQKEVIAKARAEGNKIRVAKEKEELYEKEFKWSSMTPKERMESVMNKLGDKLSKVTNTSTSKKDNYFNSVCDNIETKVVRPINVRRL